MVSFLNKMVKTNVVINYISKMFVPIRRLWYRVAVVEIFINFDYHNFVFGGFSLKEPLKS
jgi:hypothetical protein